MRFVHAQLEQAALGNFLLRTLPHIPPARSSNFPLLPSHAVNGPDVACRIMAAVNQNMFDASITIDRPGGASLMRLPLNLIAQIVSNVEDTGDLARLCRTCRVLNYMALPQLYRSLTLTSYDKIRYRGEQPEGIGSASPFTMGLNAVITRPYAKLVQSITLRGDWKESELEEHAQVGRVPDSSMLLNIAVRAAVDRMTNLESFSWELNTKMLETVYQGLTQLPKLTSLTIRFPSTRHPQPTYVLPGMPHLRCLKITDIDPLCYPDDIATMLFKSRKLRELKLHWSPRMRIAQEPSVSLHDYFRKCIAAKQPLSVKKLSFQNMYAFHSEEFNIAFDPTTVEDVTFLSGTDNTGFVNTFVENSWPTVVPHRKLRIKSIRMDAISKRNSEFLGNFTGLERLYFVNVTADSSDYLNSPRPGYGPASSAMTPPVTEAQNGAVNSPAAASPASQLSMATSVRDSYMSNIATNHGSTLRHLLLSSKWPLSTGMIARLVHSCPNLEQLALATEFSSMESLGMLVPFLRKLVALRLLIPAGSPSPSNAPNSATSTTSSGVAGEGLGKFTRAAKSLAFSETPSIKMLREIERAADSARSLADIVDLDDELLMQMMSYDLADKNVFGNVKVVGMGWKSFELRDFYKAPVPVYDDSAAQSPDPAFDNSAEKNGGVNSTPNPAHTNGTDTSRPFATPGTNAPPSTLGKRTRDDDEDNESRSRQASHISDTRDTSECTHPFAAKTGCFPPVMTNDGQVMRRRMRRVGWEVLQHWEIWALDAQEI
ncbi:hypothetical protein N7532_005663 [Penicillium argentinense]|uniref:F-box domain-containing protein n=1 Tax=Penicillium argentinense TaxID=1131581 RepID=A0A9W9FEW1_9EURO|nr:uncharacterized protein N7532_005663 [Penicillium argentinense]KAJ5098662.1 hypothetical protein N7532_005663 [Penicillium argentinense]